MGSFVYQKLEHDFWVLMVGYIPAGGGSGTEASCILIKFDEHGVFSDFNIKHGGAVLSGGWYDSGVPDCRGAFPVGDSDRITAWLSFPEGQRWADTVSGDVLFKHYRENPRDQSRFQWLCHAAKKGNPAALGELRHFYWHATATSGNELVTEEELAEGRAIFAKWGLDHCESQLLKEQNYPNFLIWIVRGASKGNVSDMMKLYWANPTGPSATKWLCRVADMGKANAQSRVGLLYMQGTEGLPKNSVKAYVWYRLAAANGSEAASQQALMIKESLTARELIEAEKALEQWKPGECGKDLLRVPEQPMIN